MPIAVARSLARLQPVPAQRERAEGGPAVAGGADGGHGRRPRRLQERAGMLSSECLSEGGTAHVLPPLTAAFTASSKPSTLPLILAA